MLYEVLSCHLLRLVELARLGKVGLNIEALSQVCARAMVSRVLLLHRGLRVGLHIDDTDISDGFLNY